METIKTMSFQPLSPASSVPIVLVDTPVTDEEIKNLYDQVAAEEQISCPLTHYHIQAKEDSPLGGIYAREIFIPAGSIVVGKVHKYEQLNIMSKGDITLATKEGVVRIKAPYTVISPAGVQRIVYAHEDTVWTTIHGTNELDLDVIESKFIAQSYDEYLLFVEEQKLLKGD